MANILCVKYDTFGNCLSCFAHQSKRLSILYIITTCVWVRACVRPSDGTVPRFNEPAEPARTVGFWKREPARIIGFHVVREDQETEISRRVSAATEQIWPRDENLEASFRCYWTNPTMIFWLIFLVVVILRIIESCRNWRENYSHDQRIAAETPENQSHF
jgi:hypothetical protein